MLDAVNADELFGGINPVKDAVVAHAELAESVVSTDERTAAGISTVSVFMVADYDGWAGMGRAFRFIAFRTAAVWLSASVGEWRKVTLLWVKIMAQTSSKRYRPKIARNLHVKYA